MSCALHQVRHPARLALDGTGSLVYHRSVAGPEVDADTFEAVDFEGWRAVAVDGPRGVPMAQLRTPLTPGVIIEPLEVSAPAVPATAANRGWQVCPLHDDPRMEVVSEHIRLDLAGGADALWLRAGLDHGTRVLTPGDLDVVLRHVDLATTPIFLEPEVDAVGMASCLVAVAEKRAIAWTDLRGGFGADPVGALLRSGVQPAGLSGALRDLTAIASWAARHAPGMRAALVSTQPYHDAGASPSEEIAWAVGTALEYIRTMRAAGLDLGVAAAQLQLQVCVAGRPFVEVAKLRALRWVWSKVASVVGLEGEGRRLPMHVTSGTAHRTNRDPWVNQIRGTSEVFAAAVGGADSIACLPFDATVGPSTAASRRLARNTQLVLRDEAHLGRVQDPAGGSHSLDALTDALAREAWSLLQEVEQEGGMLRAARTGFISSVLAASSAPRRDRIARRMEPVLGVTEFANLDEPPLDLAPVVMEEVEVELGNSMSSADPEERHQALLAIAKVAADRDAGRSAALMECAVAGARLGVDIFSLATLLRSGRGSLHLEPLRPLRAAGPFERLRDASDGFASKNARAPRALVVLLADAATARVEWVANLLAAAGIEHRVVEGEALAAQAQDHAPFDVGVLCGANASYDASAGEVAATLKAKGARLVLVAGKPAQMDALRKKGVDAKVAVGDDLLAVLEMVLRVIGALK